MKTLLLGAVAYDPKVVPIWDIIRDYANAFGCKLDYVLFSNYERQVDSLLKRHIDIAWNTNVAWIRTLYATNNTAEALIMRDSDIDFKTHFVSRKNDSIHTLSDLKGKVFGVGSLDSAQAAIMSIYYLQRDSGLEIEIFESYAEFTRQGRKNADSIALIRYNSDLGKHGDTGTSEFDVLEAIKKGELDAGSIGSSTWIRILTQGEYPTIESFWASPGYCHCNFSVLPSLDRESKEQFCAMLLSQNDKKHDPLITKMMQMEGLNAWVKVGNQELAGYDAICEAMKEQNLLTNNL